MSDSTLVMCPKCQRELSLPVDLRRDDVVRCPLCQQQFAASDIALPPPPALEIVRRKSADRDVKRANRSTAEVPNPSSTQIHNDVAAAQTIDQNQDEPVNDQAAIVVNTRLNDAPKTVYERRRYYSESQLAKAPVASSKRYVKLRKQTFGAADVLKIVVGALIAVPVAQLILWWVLGRDPFHAGKLVSHVIPVIVPSDFRDGIQSVPDEVTQEKPQSLLRVESQYQFSDLPPEPAPTETPSSEKTPKEPPQAQPAPPESPRTSDANSNADGTDSKPTDKSGTPKTRQ